jgi:hypothetical protein
LSRQAPAEDSRPCFWTAILQGNLIGTNAAGTAVLNNTSQVSHHLSNNNPIGGTVALARNVISGSGGNGAQSLRQQWHLYRRL